MRWLLVPTVWALLICPADAARIALHETRVLTITNLGDPATIAVNGAGTRLVRSNRLSAGSSAFELLDIPTGRVVWQQVLPGYASHFAFSHDSRFLAVAEESTLEIYSLETHHRVWKSPRQAAQSLLFSPDDSQLLVGGIDPVFAVVDSASGAERWHTSRGSPVISIGVDPQRHLIATGSNGGGIRLWDAAKGRELPNLRIKVGPSGSHTQSALSGVLAHEGYVYSVAFTSNGRLISGGGDGSIRIWDPIARTVLHEFICENYGRLAVNSRDEAAIACYAHGAIVVDARTGARKGALFENNFGNIAISATDLGWVVGSADGTLKLWPYNSGAPQLISGRLTALAVSSDGRQAGYTLGDGVAHIVALPTGRQIATIRGLVAPDLAEAFSRAYTTVAIDSKHQELAAATFTTTGFVDHSGVYRAVVRVFDYDGHVLGSFPGVDAAALIFSPDGRRLIAQGPALSDTPYHVTILDLKHGVTKTWIVPRNRMEVIEFSSPANRSLAFFLGSRPSILVPQRLGDSQNLVLRALPGGNTLRVLPGALPNGRFILGLDERSNEAYALSGGDFRTWSLRGPEHLRHRFALPAETNIYAADVADDAVAAVVRAQGPCSDGYTVMLFRVFQKGAVGAGHGDGCAADVAIARDSGRITVKLDNGLVVWEP